MQSDQNNNIIVLKTIILLLLLAVVFLCLDLALTASDVQVREIVEASKSELGQVIEAKSLEQHLLEALRNKNQLSEEASRLIQELASSRSLTDTDDNFESTAYRRYTKMNTFCNETFRLNKKGDHEFFDEPCELSKFEGYVSDHLSVVLIYDIVFMCKILKNSKKF